MLSRSLFTILALSVPFSDTLAAQPGFTARDLRGTFAFSLQGTLVRAAMGTPIPISAFDTLTLDGEGKVTKALRTLNVAGQGVRETATGTYTVNSDGLGSATLTVFPTDGEPPVVRPTREVFHFAMVKPPSWDKDERVDRGRQPAGRGLLPSAKADFLRQEEL